MLARGSRAVAPRAAVSPGPRPACLPRVRRLVGPHPQRRPSAPPGVEPAANTSCVACTRPRIGARQDALRLGLAAGGPAHAVGRAKTRFASTGADAPVLRAGALQDALRLDLGRDPPSTRRGPATCASPRPGTNRSRPRGATWSVKDDREAAIVGSFDPRLANVARRGCARPAKSLRYKPAHRWSTRPGIRLRNQDSSSA